MINVMFSGDFVSRLNVKTDPLEAALTSSPGGTFENGQVWTLTDSSAPIRNSPLPSVFSLCNGQI